MKTALTPIDMIKAAYFHHVVGLNQTQIATVLEVSNMGRVNEAIKKIEGVLGMSGAARPTSRSGKSKRNRGRPTIGARAMTPAERQRRHRSGKHG